jgi:hypothetical protein
MAVILLGYSDAQVPPLQFPAHPHLAIQKAAGFLGQAISG